MAIRNCVDLAVGTHAHSECGGTGGVGEEKADGEAGGKERETLHRLSSFGRRECPVDSGLDSCGRSGRQRDCDEQAWKIALTAQIVKARFCRL